MDNVIVKGRGNIPAPEQLQLGQWGINVDDNRFYYKNDDGKVMFVLEAIEAMAGGGSQYVTSVNAQNPDPISGAVVIAPGDIGEFGVVPFSDGNSGKISIDYIPVDKLPKMGFIYQQDWDPNTEELPARGNAPGSFCVVTADCDTPTAQSLNLAWNKGDYAVWSDTGVGPGTGWYQMQSHLTLRSVNGVGRGDQDIVLKASDITEGAFQASVLGSDATAGYQLTARSDGTDTASWVAPVVVSTADPGDVPLATGKNSVAVGYGSIAESDNEVSVGNQSTLRKITNAAPGKADTDVATLGQVKQLLGSPKQAYKKWVVDPAKFTVTVDPNDTLLIIDNKAIEFNKDSVLTIEFSDPSQLEDGDTFKFIMVNKVYNATLPAGFSYPNSGSDSNVMSMYTNAFSMIYEKATSSFWFLNVSFD